MSYSRKVRAVAGGGAMNYSEIIKIINALEVLGIPAAGQVPVFQADGSVAWATVSGGTGYTLTPLASAASLPATGSASVIYNVSGDADSSLDGVYIWDAVDGIYDFYAANPGSSNDNAPRLPQTLAQMDTTGLVANWLLDGSLTDLVSGLALTRAGTWNATSNNMLWDIDLNQYVPVFTGANYYAFPLTGFPANTAAQTLMSWARFRATDQVVVCGYNAHVGGMHYGGLSATGDSSTQMGLNLLSDGAWHHLANVFNGATRNFYVDGILHYSAAESPTYTYATGAIGAYVVGNLKLVGYVAGVRVYSEALSAERLTAIAKGAA